MNEYEYKYKYECFVCLLVSCCAGFSPVGAGTASGKKNTRSRFRKPAPNDNLCSLSFGEAMRFEE